MNTDAAQYQYLAFNIARQLPQRRIGKRLPKNLDKLQTVTQYVWGKDPQSPELASAVTEFIARIKQLKFRRYFLPDVPGAHDLIFNIQRVTGPTVALSIVIYFDLVRRQTLTRLQAVLA